MPEQNVTTKFKVDVSEFKAGIADANKQIKLANAEFKAASSGMDDWENSSEGLQAKLKQLESIIEAENAKLKAYKGQLEAVENASQENAKRADSLRSAYQEAVKQFGENSEEAKTLKKALSDVTKEQESNEKAADNLRVTILNQTAAVNKAEREYRNFTDELNDLESGAGEAENSLDDLDEAASSSGDGFTIAKGAIADFISDGIQNLISKIGEAVNALLELPEATREYREDMAKLETAFTDAGHTTETAEKAYRDFYGILGESDRSVEAVNHLAQLTDNTEELSKWSTIAAGVTAKFGDSLPIEGLTEAANETARTGQLTGPLTDALNWAAAAGETFGVTLKENTKENKAWNKKVEEATTAEEYFQLALEQCSTEQERATLITETMNGLYADAAKQYTDMNDSIIEAREATADFEQAQADLGNALEPVTTAFTNLKTQALELILPLIEKLVQKLGDFKTWAEENPQKMEVIKGVLIGIATALGLVVAAVGAAMIVQGLTKAFQLLNITMLANPIVLIIAAIAGLVAAFIYLWNNCDEFREFWINLWEKIKEVAGTAWEAITNFFTEAWEAIKRVWSAVKGWFLDVWEGIKNVFSSVGSWFSEKFETAKENVLEAWSNIKEKFGEIWQKIKDAFKFDDMFDIGRQLLEGLWNGINDKVAWLKQQVKGVVEKIKSWFTGSDGFDEHSPSKWSKGVAEYVMRGLDNGFDAGLPTTLRTARSATDSIKGAIAGIDSGSFIASGTTGAASGSVGGGFVFNQYNTSPKALSRIEIYRQTQNALRFAGGNA